MHGVDGAGARARGNRGEQAARIRSEASLLALHVPGRLVDVLSHSRGYGRVGALFAGHRHEGARRQHDDHDCEQRPALSRVAGHSAECVGQGERDDQDEQHLEPVREPRRVLEWLGRVGVEEAAAVGAQFLDGFLRGDGTERDRLHGPLEGVNGEGTREGLDHALGNEYERRNEGDRQQDVEGAAGHVDPEVADGRR